MLCFVYMLNFLDRQLLAILAKPIQDTLHVSDHQLGLIGGLYFALFYCFIAIPVGWLADKTSRVQVLSLGCAIWSAATVACGLAASYSQLVVARMTVGFGEAGGVPPSYSIISDYFPPQSRGTALGIYNLGPPVGAALGIAFGASIAAPIVGGAHSSFLARRRTGRDRRAAHRARAPSRRPRFRSRAREFRQGKLLANPGDVPFAPRADAHSPGERSHSIYYLWPRQLRDSFPDAREGYVASRSRRVLRVGRGNRDERGHLCFRAADRPF